MKELWPGQANFCDLDLQPTSKNVSNGTSPLQGQQLCQIILNPCINVRVNALKNPKEYHTCDIFLEPDREIWDFSEGDWGLR